MKNIEHIFFDLDRTLWDFDTNSRLTLIELFQKFKLEKFTGSNPQDFISTYEKHNDLLWEAYRKKEVSKSFLRVNRFEATLKELSIDLGLNASSEMADYYVEESPNKTLLFDGTIAMLEALKHQFHLHIITNGFKEIQYKKLINCNIIHYFDEIICSEETGFQKPDPRIYLFAMQKTRAKPQTSLMVGDDIEVDLVGAQNCRMNDAWFNPQAKFSSLKVGFEYQKPTELVEYLLD